MATVPVDQHGSGSGRLEITIFVHFLRYQLSFYQAAIAELYINFLIDNFFISSIYFCNACFICLCIYLFIYHTSSKTNLYEELTVIQPSHHSRFFQGELENPTMIVTAQLHILKLTAAQNKSVVQFKQ